MNIFNVRNIFKTVGSVARGNTTLRVGNNVFSRGYAGGSADFSRANVASFGHGGAGDQPTTALSGNPAQRL